jgi:hypothetical protein
VGPTRQLAELRVLLAELRSSCWVGGAGYPLATPREASCVAALLNAPLPRPAPMSSS